MGPAFIVLGWFMLFAGLSQMAAFVIFQHWGNNILFYNSTLLVNYGLLYGITIHLLDLPAYKRKINAVYIAGAIGVIIFIVPANTDYFASRSLTIINLVVVASCLLYFYDLLKIPETLPITRQGKFWIGAALLVHHVSSFTLWLVYELITNVEKAQTHAIMGSILTIILYVMLIIATIVQINATQYAERK